MKDLVGSVGLFIFLSFIMYTLVCIYDHDHFFLWLILLIGIGITLPIIFWFFIATLVELIASCYDKIKSLIESRK